jgi:N utilization substance protein A
MQLLIQRALSPAKISSIKINEEEKKVGVYLKPNDVSLAIGKGGSNIKLAGMLIGMEIDVFRDLEDEDEEDVLLSDFSDEIDEWIITALNNIGCDTAKSVLALPVSEIVRRADLDDETVAEVQRILRAEFEE